MVWEADLFFDVDRFDCFDVYLFDCFDEDLFYCLDVDLFVLGTALFDGRARVEAGFVLIGGFFAGLVDFFIFLSEFYFNYILYFLYNFN